MIGCAFAVDRDYFFAIGAFDAAMNIWGGENVELSVRVWRCGGYLLKNPCSRVGHVYRVVHLNFTLKIRLLCVLFDIFASILSISRMMVLYKYSVTPLVATTFC